MTQALSRLTTVALVLFAAAPCAWADFATGESPSVITGGDYLVLNGAQNYTLDTSISGLAMITIGGRYNSTVSEVGIDNNTFRMDGTSYTLSFSSSAALLYVGNNGGDFNTANFSNGATLSVNGVSVGCASTNNTVTFRSGSVLTAGSLEVGQEGGNGNKINFHGSSTRATLDYLDVGYSTSSASTDNSLIVSGGAKVTASGASFDSTIGYSAGSNNNSIRVNGAGSSLSFGYSYGGGYCLEIGGSSSTGNTLSIETGGLVVLGTPSLTGTSVTIADGNYIRFADGVLAIGGNVIDNLETLLDGHVMAFDGSQYYAVTWSDLYFQYGSSEEAVTAYLTSCNLTGYGYNAANLVGYTLISGGAPMEVVPEPSAFALVGGVGALALCLKKRARK